MNCTPLLTRLVPFFIFITLYDKQEGGVIKYYSDEAHGFYLKGHIERSYMTCKLFSLMLIFDPESRGGYINLFFNYDSVFSSYYACACYICMWILGTWKNYSLSCLLHYFQNSYLVD